MCPYCQRVLRRHQRRTSTPGSPTGRRTRHHPRRWPQPECGWRSPPPSHRSLRGRRPIGPHVVHDAACGHHHAVPGLLDALDMVEKPAVEAGIVGGRLTTRQVPRRSGAPSTIDCASASTGAAWSSRIFPVACELPGPGRPRSPADLGAWAVPTKSSTVRAGRWTAGGSWCRCQSPQPARRATPTPMSAFADPAATPGRSTAATSPTPAPSASCGVPEARPTDPNGGQHSRR